MSARAVRLRRRSKRSLAARLRTYWILVTAVVALAVLAGWSLASAPVFRVASLDVTGVLRVSKDDVLARAALDPAANVWLVDKAAMERRIDALPFVLTARIHRAFPAHVRIEIVEREPAGCLVSDDGTAFTIDRDDRVLATGCAASPLPRFRRDAGAPRPGAFLHDPRLAQLQADALALDGAPRFIAFAFDGYDRLEATLASGVVVRFGDDGDLAAKRRLLGPILAQLGPRATRLRAVDLRAPATPVVEYR